MPSIFPDPITALPLADIPMEGLTAFVSQSDTHQILFMQFDQDTKIAEHTHGAQVGIVLQGRIDLNINGEEFTHTRGGRYYIPDGVPHSATIYAGYADITFSDEPDRYGIKT